MSDKPEYAKTFLHASKLKRRGKKWGNGREPSFYWSFYDNNPQINLYMNDGKVKNYVNIGMSPDMAQELMDLIISVSNDVTQSYTVEYKNKRDHTGTYTDEPAVVAKIIIGRNAKECVQMTIQLKREEPAEFPFGDEWRNIIDTTTGEQLSAAKLSEVAARAYACRTSAMLTAELVAHGTVPIERKPPGQGGGNQRRGGGSWSDDNTSAY